MPNAQAILGAVQAGVEAAAVVPVVAPFEPLLLLALTIIKTHFNATGQFPPLATIQAGLPSEYKALQSKWAAWDTAHATIQPPSA